MTSRVFHLTSANTINLTQIGNSPAQLTGYDIVNTSTTTDAFVKFWWGNANSFANGSDKPTLGTDIPNITIAVPDGAANAPYTQQCYFGNESGPMMPGNLFMATTANASDTDNTAIGSGQLIITIYYKT